MRPDVHLEPGCPWYELSELRLPNVDWCELQRCSWVVEPANTWSNLAYVAVAAILWWLARALPSPQLRFFAPAALLVGVASGIYHASYSFALQILDFLAMYVFCYLLITLNLRRLGVLGAGDWRRRFWQLVVGTTLLTVAVDFLEIPIQGLVFALILVIVGSELRIRLGGRGEPGGVPGTPLPTWPIFSRWLTHLCAPTFVFLAGTALALSLERRSRGGQSGGELDRQIVTRGAIIAALDPTVVSLGSGRLTFQVLYAIGVSMMLTRSRW